MIRIKQLLYVHIIYYVIVLNPLSVLIAFQTNKDTLSPEIKFKSLRYDAGLVKPGDKVQGSFIIENRGKSDLEIKSVTPT